MLVDVDLAGVRLPWHLGRTDGVARWLERRPWSGDGGAVFVRADGPRHRELVAEGVLDRFRRLEGAREGHDVHAWRVELEDGAKDALARLRGWLELGEPGPAEDPIASTAGALAGMAPLFVVEPAGRGAGAARFAEELERTLRALHSRDRRASAAAIVLSPERGDGFDLRRGMPLHVAAGWGGSLAVWDRYLHFRLAWESGGELDRALAWQDAAREVRAGDDAALESRLNALAGEAWTALASVTKRRLVDRIARPIPIGGVDAWLDEDDLEALAWSPGGVVEPVPWLARAVLGREGRSSPARGALRAALTCAPLRDAVVARCLSWEARLRGAYVPVGQPPPRAAAAFADLERGQGPDRAGYPPECPALPRSAWELVPLGEFVSALPATPAARVMNEVRTLRNSMAHGHYVSWATLLRADALDAGLGPRPIRDRDAR